MKSTFVELATVKERENVDLVIIECECGFYSGWEQSYLERVGDIVTDCPHCGETHVIPGTALCASYSVAWRIDIEARSPEEAARLALEIQRDPQSTATVFEVRDQGGNCIEFIDLEGSSDD